MKRLMLVLAMVLVLLLPSITHAVEFETIRANMKNMTTAAWFDYCWSLKGKRVGWTGWVKDVVKDSWGDSYTVLVDMDPLTDSLFSQDVYIKEISKKLAIQFKKGQRIRFRGSIRSIQKGIVETCVVILNRATFTVF